MNDSSNLFGNGFGVALITPFLPEGAIDEVGLVRIVQHVVEGGADFLVALGSTGEAAMLDEAERQRVVAIVNEHRGDAKMLVGTGTSATASTCTWTRTAQDSGAHGALIAMPPYTKPTQAGIVAHFAAIAEAAPGLPLVAYNVPGRTGVNLTPATVRELWRIPTVVALKESSNDLMQISQIANELPEGKTLLGGDDALLLPTIAVGGHGIVSVAGNIVPGSMRDLLAAARASDLEAAQQQIVTLQPLFEALNLEPNPIPIKAAMALAGMAYSAPRLPLLPATEATRIALRPALQQTRSLTINV
ncbi:MAG: 4-hydroxy-tetrahydrodipicolinate synthase [Planctomycetota bacterium]|jgi:4-hydroxy-tetrahydrodipicolinate synthase